MNRWTTIPVSLLACAGFALPMAPSAMRRTPVKRARRAAPAAAWTAETVNNPSLTPVLGPRSSGPAVLRAQILLGRARFSAGELDGAFGENMSQLVSAYQQAHQLQQTSKVDAATWQALNADTAPALTTYTVTEADVNTPFVEIPKEMEEQAKLPALGYRNMEEMLGEKYHCSPAMLAKLNPGKNLEKPGTEIVVPNVENSEAPPKAAAVTVSKSTQLVTATDKDGTVLAAFRATIGSEHDPLPVGDWKITGVQKNPPFYYNPALFWDAKPTDEKAKIPPGPNGPVGVVWIGLSKEHYGIHGTPEPGNIGHTQSHGCIRLTNWDALTLASMVHAGVPAHLVE